MQRRHVFVVLSAAAVVFAGCTSSAIADRRTRTLPDGFLVPKGATLIGAPIPSQPFPVASRDHHEWTALLRIDGGTAKVYRGFSSLVTAAGLDPLPPAETGCAAPLDPRSTCHGSVRMTSPERDLTIDVGGCLLCEHPSLSSYAVITYVRVARRAPPIWSRVVSDTAEVPPARTMTSLISGAKRLAEFDAGCNRPMSLYAVTDDPDALWRRLKNVEGTVTAAARSIGNRRVRWLTESGMDYDITATLIEGPDLASPVLAVLPCD